MLFHYAVGWGPYGFMVIQIESKSSIWWVLETCMVQKTCRFGICFLDKWFGSSSNELPVKLLIPHIKIGWLPIWNLLVPNMTQLEGAYHHSNFVLDSIEVANKRSLLSYPYPIHTTFNLWMIVLSVISLIDY